ncbi:MAG: glycosyltransferase family 9 protein [Chitinispirillaceae bacterium]
MNSTHRSFILHAGALGDFFTCLPAISEWRRITCADHYTLAASPALGQFARECCAIHNCIDVTAPSSAFLFGEDESKLASFLSQFRSALLFTNNSALVKTAESLGMKPLLSQTPFPETAIPIHVYHLSLFSNHSFDFGITIPPAATHKSEELVSPNGRNVLIHTGSGSRRKNWPRENFLLLSDKLRSEGYHIVWIEGPAETGYTRFPTRDTVLRNLPLSVLAAVMKRCSIYIGNDSGPSHLSSALGMPSVVIFGPSDPRVWKPAGQKVRTIHKNLPCSPCHGKSLPPRCTNECLNSISVDDVFREVRRFIYI